MDLQVLAVAAGFSDQVLSTIYSLMGSYGAVGATIAKIIGINIVLSGDNAVVIALACRALPHGQRMLGILLGAGAAVLLRIIFTVIVNELLEAPYLKLVGGLLLLWIAVKLLVQEEPDEDSVRSGSSIWEAVKIVAIADIVMSLDNVLAIAAAAGGDIILIIAGLIISIPLVVGGATLITRLLTRFPILVWAGAALLGWIAGELLATEPALSFAVDYLRERLNVVPELLHVTPKTIVHLFEATGALLVVLVGWISVRWSNRPAQGA